MSVLSVIVPNRASIAARKPRIIFNSLNNLVPPYTKRSLSSVDIVVPE